MYESSNDALFKVLKRDPKKAFKKKSQKRDSLDTLYRILIWIAFDDIGTSKSSITVKKCSRFIYPFFAHLAALDAIFICIFHVRNVPENPQVIVAYVSVIVLLLLQWYAFYKNGKSLKKVFIHLKRMSSKYKVSNKPRSKTLIFLLIFNVLLAIIFSLSFILFPNDSDFMCNIYFYYIEHVCTVTVPNQIYLYVKVFFTRMPVFFNNFLSFIYCCLCYRCTILLRRYTERFNKIAFLKNSLISHEVALEYHNLHDIVSNLQSTFSLSSLLMLIVAFTQAFTFLARLFLYFEDELTLFYLIEHFCVSIPSASFTFILPAFAAQVSREMLGNKEKFQKLYGNIIFKSHGDSKSITNLRVLSILKRIKPVQLSGWEIVEFTGGTMPVILGTLITYGLLILTLSV